ncbi:unnamed protein product, partial [Mycena citricolor]
QPQSHPPRVRIGLQRAGIRGSARRGSVAGDQHSRDSENEREVGKDSHRPVLRGETSGGKGRTKASDGFENEVLLAMLRHPSPVVHLLNIFGSW